MKKYDFFHNALMNNYKVVNDQVFVGVVDSGILEDLDKLYICNLGNGSYNPLIPDKWLDKVEYLNVGEHVGLFEFPTLDRLKQRAKEEECYLMYFSNLGVGHNNMPTAKSWRDLLSHFVVKNYKGCIEDLDNGYDVSGADWNYEPLPHYSGTWWWANSKYINTLMELDDCKQNLQIPGLGSIRHRAEMWIGSNSDCKPKRNFDCGFHWTKKPLRINWLDYIK